MVTGTPVRVGSCEVSEGEQGNQLDDSVPLSTVPPTKEMTSKPVAFAPNMTLQ